VKNIHNDNFIAIASFLDGGRTYRKIGVAAIPTDSMMMVKYTKKPGFKNLNADDVTLTFKRKAAPAKKGETYTGYLNTNSRVFTFSGLKAGVYDATIKNSKKGDSTEELPVSASDNYSYAYDPKDKSFRVAGADIERKLTGIFTLREIVIKGLATRKVPVPKLNRDGFEIEFEIFGADVSTFNKGVLVSLHNSNGPLYNNNGGRIEIIIRGTNAENPIHARKAMLAAVVDKNSNAHLDDALGEFQEEKSHQTWDWGLLHKIKLRVETVKGECVMSMFVDGQFIFDRSWSLPYWNDKPVLSIGGYNTHVEYKPPINAKITNLELRNIKK
jgi:hypothetical protein